MYSNGQLTFTPAEGGAGWVDDVSTLVQAQERLGSRIHHVAAPRALRCLFGHYMANPSVPMYANGVIKLDKLKGPTVVGYMYGGIFSTVAQTSGDPIIEETQTGASNQVFQVTVTPTRRKA